MTRDLRNTRNLVQQQTPEYAAAKAAAYHGQDQDTGSVAGSDCSEDCDDEGGMAFTPFGPRSNDCHSSAPPTPVAKRARVDDMEPVGTAAQQLYKHCRSPTASTAGLVPEPETANMGLPNDEDAIMAEVGDRDAEGKGQAKGRGAGRGRGRDRHGSAGAKPGSTEQLRSQLCNDRETYSDSKLWSTKVKDKVILKMTKVLEGLIDKVILSNDPSQALIEARG